MMALITSALQGLAAIQKIWEKIDKLNLDARLNAIEKKQELSDQAFMKLASAKTDEEYDDALKDIADSLNK